MLTIEVSTVDGKRVSIKASYTETIATIKDRIERVTSFGRVRNLVRKGTVLKDEKTVAESAIENGDLLIATCQTSATDQRRSTSQAAAAGVDEIEADPSPKQAEAPKNKCKKCGTSLNLVEQNMPCRCKAVFCDRHRAPEKHHCTFDHALLERAKLASQLIPKDQKAGGESASAVFIYGEYCSSHSHKRCRQLHAAAFALLTAGVGMSVGAEWDGVGVPTWIMRMAFTLTASYCIAHAGHSQYGNPQRAGQAANLPIFCLWSSSVKTHPFQCIKSELKNLARVVVDLVTADRTNSYTPHFVPYAKRFDPH